MLLAVLFFYKHVIKIVPNSIIVGDSNLLARMRDDFDQRHCVVIREFISDALIARIQNSIDSARFYRNKHIDRLNNEFAHDLTLVETEFALHLAHFLLNNAELFRAIEFVTGCPRIGSFGGRIYRNLPESGDSLDWHDDADIPERLLGLSINLNKEACDGGVFQLRRRDTAEILCEVFGGKAGDAHFFKIGSGLQHRVTPVVGQASRTSIAGWMYSKPDRREAINSLFVQSPVPDARQHV